MYPQNAYRAQEYRNHEVMTSSPLHLVVMAYDLAIRSCEQQDFEKSVRTISALRDALDFDYPEVSVGLFKLYQWCLDNIRKGDYDAALSVLRELREAWYTTEKRMTSRPASAQSAYTAVARPA